MEQTLLFFFFFFFYRGLYIKTQLCSHISTVAACLPSIAYEREMSGRSLLHTVTDEDASTHEIVQYARTYTHSTTTYVFHSNNRGKCTLEYRFYSLWPEEVSGYSSTHAYCLKLHESVKQLSTQSSQSEKKLLQQRHDNGAISLFQSNS